MTSYKLGPEALSQIGYLVRQEMLQLVPAIRAKVQQGFGVQAVYVAYTPSGGIPARSANVCGSALCTVQKVATDGTMTNAIDQSGAAIQVRVYNPSGSAVTGSTYIQCIEETPTGRLMCMFEDC